MSLHRNSMGMGLTSFLDSGDSHTEERADLRTAEADLEAARERFRAALREARNAGASSTQLGELIGLSRQRVAHLLGDQEPSAQTENWPYGLELCLPQLRCLASQKARRRALGLRPESWLQGQWRRSYTQFVICVASCFSRRRADTPPLRSR